MRIFRSCKIGVHINFCTPMSPISLTPCFSGVLEAVTNWEPLQRFIGRSKPLKRLRSLAAPHTPLERFHKLCSVTGV